MDGSPITGGTPTVTISKDGGSFANATNTPAEIGNGYYYIDLTQSEITVNNNVIIRAAATGAQPTAIVWEPEQTVPTAADNASAVWGAAQKVVTIDSTQAATFATATTLSTVGDNVSAVKAKTDNLPTNLAADLDKLLAGILYWAVVANTLTLYNSNNTVLATYTLTRDTEGNIIKVEPN